MQAGTLPPDSRYIPLPAKLKLKEKKQNEKNPAIIDLPAPRYF
jgi:hypothetical protein